jgi:hypothetical protein
MDAFFVNGKFRGEHNRKAPGGKSDGGAMTAQRRADGAMTA